jgi:hypothetical protein
MSTNKLAQVIRKMVREEVRKEVRQVLNEQKAPKSTKSEFKSGLKHALGLQDLTERRARAPKAVKQYTKNAMLNAILNETAGEIADGNVSRLTEQTVEYPTMGNQTYTSTNADTFDRKSLAAKMGYGDVAQTSTPSIQEMVPTRNTSGGRTNNQDVDPSVAKALTRDYSELVKKFKR